MGHPAPRRQARVLSAAPAVGDDAVAMAAAEAARLVGWRTQEPLSATNLIVEGVEVDCTRPAARLIVELDSGTHHGTADAFERDRRRDHMLAPAGWRVIRVTWRQLHDEPEALARDLRALLATTA